jgi:hypothetical protein
VVSGTGDADADAEVDGTVVELARGEDTQWCREHDAGNRAPNDRADVRLVLFRLMFEYSRGGRVVWIAGGGDGGEG